MKRLGALLLAPLLAGCSMVGIRSGTEEPTYEVVSSAGDVEIRRYTSRLMAEISVRANDEVGARNAGFGPLAGYIFGRNRAAERIGMTAPVAQSGSERIGMTSPVTQSGSGGEWVIGFLMPARYTSATLPRPEDSRITIREVPAETLAVLRFSGSTGPAAVAEAQARLTSGLATMSWRATLPGGAWFYDPPWTIPALRRNEVWVPVSPH